MEQWFEAAKGEVAVEYLSNLCKSSNPSSFEAFFCGMAPKVTAEMNADLVARVPDEEIREAVFAIKPLTAPRPDGVTVFFFQKYLDVVGQQVTKEVQNFFDSGIMPTKWNFKHLCLLPKFKNPQLMTDLCPISICSILYTINSKVLVRCLQPLLPSMVSINQSVFVS